MQFNGETNNQDLCSLADGYAKSNVGTFPLKKKALYANMSLREMWAWIFSAYAGWNFDDTNQTTQPQATTTVTASTNQITMPLDSAHLQGVAYQDSTGSWYSLKPITLEQIQERAAESEFMKTPGNPEYYRPVADGFKIYPSSSVTITIGIFISRDVSAFVPGDTIKNPGIPSEFHEGIAVGMALQHARINSLPIVKDLQKQWDGNEDVTGKRGGYKDRIIKFYGNRFRQLFPPRIRTRDVSRNYI